MTKPKIIPKSKYVKNNSEEYGKEEVSLENRAQEFLASGTPASYVTQVALALVLISGMVIAGAMAPGLSIVAQQYRRSKYYSKKELANASCRLKRNGHVEEYITKNGAPRIRLTKKGEKYFQKILFEDVQLPEPEKWAGKWTFVLFDIPVQFSKARESLRWRLKALGFYQYQKSVWVYPHPCEKEILYIADYFGVGKFVEILSADYLSKEADLKKYFHLK